MATVRSQPVWAYLMTILLTAQVTLIAVHIHAPHHADEMGSAIHALTHAPADHTTPDGPTHDRQFCPICWLQHASGGQLLPSPPLLTLLDWLAALRVLDSTAVRADQQAFPPFQPRAPPGAVV